MSHLLDYSFPSSDGIHTVHAQIWLPEEPVRGVVQIVHGISEYVGRYDHVARFLNEHGFVVCGEDHLGHGKTASDGKFGYFGERNGWDYVCQDVHRLRELQGEQYPGVPYVLLGHSMGSFLARNYLFRWPGDVDAAILSGTGQEAPALVAGGKLLANLLCRLKGSTYVSPLIYSMSLGAYNKQFAPNRTRADWISRDEAAVDAYVADPLCRFSPTCALFRDMMGGLQAIADSNNLSKMDKNTPVYFMSGDQDPVGAMGKSVVKVAEWFRQAGCTNVTVKLYPEGRHEMFNETNKQEVMDDLLSWLEKTI